MNFTVNNNVLHILKLPKNRFLTFSLQKKSIVEVMYMLISLTESFNNVYIDENVILCLIKYTITMCQLKINKYINFTNEKIHVKH